MPCPNCGSSTARRELAPGFFECLNVFVAETPNPMHPQFGTVRQEYVCGTRYQEAPAGSSALGLCHVCNSIAAVGLCADCGRPVDGICGTTSAGVGILCPSCLTSRRHTQRAAQERSEAAAAAEREAAIRAMSTVDYLIEVGTRRIDHSARSATGAEIAAALREFIAPHVKSSFDGKGALALGQKTPGVDDYIRRDGTFGRNKRFGWRSGMRDVYPPDHVYGPDETTEMVREGVKYISSISRDNNY